MQDDLTAVIPTDIRPRLVSHENQIVIPYPEVLVVIQAASQHAISVLGVELFQMLGGDLLVLDYSTYEFELQGDWELFVRSNNAEAARFVEGHVRGEEHGYILSSASKREFDELGRWGGHGKWRN